MTEKEAKKCACKICTLEKCERNKVLDEIQNSNNIAYNLIKDKLKDIRNAANG